MAKFEKKHRLNGEEQQKLLLGLCNALVVVKNLEEAANLLVDLFSRQEIEMIAKRLKVAKLLIEGKTYQEIGKELKVSSHTVARVNAWLDQSGSGYRLVIERDKDMKIPEWRPPKQWSALKRRYPMYYWPQILLEEVVRNANNRQRQKLFNVIKTIKTKSKEKYEVVRQIEHLLKTPAA